MQQRGLVSFLVRVRQLRLKDTRHRAIQGRKCLSAALQHDCACAAAAIADGCHAHSRIIAGKHVEQPHEEHGAAGADRMPQCHRAAVCIAPARTHSTTSATEWLLMAIQVHAHMQSVC